MMVLVVVVGGLASGPAAFPDALDLSVEALLHFLVINVGGTGILLRAVLRHIERHVGVHFLIVDGGDEHFDPKRQCGFGLADQRDDVVLDRHIHILEFVPHGLHTGVAVKGGADGTFVERENREHALFIGQAGYAVHLEIHPLAADRSLHFGLRRETDLFHTESGGVLAAIFFLAQGDPDHGLVVHRGDLPPLAVLHAVFYPAGAEQVAGHEVFVQRVVAGLPDARLVPDEVHEGAVVLELPAVLLTVVIRRFFARHPALPDAQDPRAEVLVQLHAADDVFFGLDQATFFPDGNGALGNQERVRDIFDMEFNDDCLTIKVLGEGDIVAENLHG